MPPEGASEVRRDVSSEIKRLCALPSPDRQAEIDRVEKEFGVVVSCGSD
jgi:hypothetical protein